MSTEIVSTQRPAPITVVPAGNDGHVSAETAALIAEATPANTARSYATAWASFADWCAATDRTALPATAETLAEYVTHLAGRGLAPSTVEHATAVIRRAHRDAGHDRQPDTRGARLALRAYRRRCAEAGRRPKQAAPAALDPIRAMLTATDPTTTAGMRDRAALAVGFAAMRRGAELVALDLADVTETTNGLIVFVRASKTDRNSSGREVMVPYKSRPATCPVRIVRAWREHLAECDITTGRLVRSVDRHGHIGPSLSTRNLSELIRRAAVRAGIPDAERYSAHSLRAGGATAAAAAGVPAAWIAEQGGWSPKSRAVHGYVRAVNAWTDNAMAAVDL